MNGGVWVDLSIRWIARRRVEYVVAVDGDEQLSQQTPFSPEDKINIEAMFQGCVDSPGSHALFAELSGAMRARVDGAIARTLDEELRQKSGRALRLRVCDELFELPWECVGVSLNGSDGETWASAYCAVRWFERAVHREMPLLYCLFADDQLAPNSRQLLDGMDQKISRYFNLIDDVDDMVMSRRRQLYDDGFRTSSIVHVVAHGDVGEDGRVTVLPNVDQARTRAGLICPEDASHQPMPEFNGDCLFSTTPLVALMDACHSAKFSLVKCFMDHGYTRLYVGHLEAATPTFGRGSVFVQHFFDALVSEPQRPLVECIRIARHAGGARGVMHDMTVCCVSSDVAPLYTLDQLLNGGAVALPQHDEPMKHWVMLFFVATALALLSALAAWYLFDTLFHNIVGSVELPILLPIATGLYAGAMCALVSRVLHSMKSHKARAASPKKTSKWM